MGLCKQRCYWGKKLGFLLSGKVGLFQEKYPSMAKIVLCHNQRIIQDFQILPAILNHHSHSLLYYYYLYSFFICYCLEKILFLHCPFFHFSTFPVSFYWQRWRKPQHSRIHYWKCTHLTSLYEEKSIAQNLWFSEHLSISCFKGWECCDLFDLTMS